MRAQDVSAFKAAARRYGVHILVRRTNPASLAYFGRQGYAAKRLDCKAKTADRDVTPPGLGPKRTAGLVVDPTLAGYWRAFKSYEKFQSALREWRKFARQLPPRPATGPDGAGYTYLPDGGLYAVQLDPGHVHYGCVMFSSSSLISAAGYVHGDFDLYDIVPRDDPSRNLIFEDRMLGNVHNRGPQLFDVQHFINRSIEVAAVLHGSQAKYAREHSDETVDVFLADGATVLTVEGKAALERLYAGEFRGRRLLEAA